MIVPQKGSRQIVVGETEFVWHIRKKPTYSQAVFQSNMTLAVQLADGSAGVLIVSLGVSRPDSWISPHQTSIKLKVVQAIIWKAFSDGWISDDPEPFYLKYQLIRDRP